MLQFLTNLTATTSSCLIFRALCSGRPANFIELAFSKVPHLHLEEHTWQDIEDFLHTNIRTVTDHLPPDERRDRIIAEIVPEVVGKSEGVFMWASVVVEDLLTLIAAGREEELYEKIKELPPELESLYASIIAKIPPRSRHHTYNYLQLQVSAGHGENAPHNLLGIMLASFPPEQVRTAPSNIDRWSDDAKIVACHRTRRMLRDNCSGFVKLPHFNPSWSKEEQVNRFCCGEVYVHKSVKDYLFNKESFKKVWSGIDQKLLIHSHLQRVSFCFHLLKVDFVTRYQAVPRIWRNEDSVLVAVPKLFLKAVSVGEVDEKLDLSVTWLLALENLVRTKASSLTEIVDFYDATFVLEYRNFERCTNDPPFEAWNTNMLCLAVSYGLIPYIKAYVHRNLHLRKGRPLLHYLFGAYVELSYDTFEPVAKILHRHGSRFDQVFNGRTTWEYILIHMQFGVYINSWERDGYDKILILCLEQGANPNQKINLPT
ncbi:uncharacterized protein LY89DRAFT_259688 [Mollisia scopiformis]|uniref:Uncharacterized protein n=1 Tax=Mollisia scopiformis TaxID=149040 RepID=A0A132BEU8_MOLSC|nr:uncharacterized protein LY89DRAFT_259688 [Mollisia scopiformis]KUJ10384.1 hypothetical protein LY89DRAFT_259688 [Mollisia scopiformis]